MSFPPEYALSQRPSSLAAWTSFMPASVILLSSINPSTMPTLRFDHRLPLRLGVNLWMK